jgi:transcriptional regulator with GAF, ATPase, and Fis domain
MYKNNNCIGFALKSGTNVTALIVFWTNLKAGDLASCNVWKSISSQLGTALSNLFVNQQLESLSSQMSSENQPPATEDILVDEEETFNDLNASYLIGSSEAMKNAYVLVGKVAATDSTVLILGETGTGKELIARAIHENSSRKLKPMIKVNCAALPANLIESELFGHERGAFTGAMERRLGKFEQANQGTLFLDEIGEMPLEMQVKLLRALQEKEIERVGGKASIKVNVRIVAATNRDLRKEMEEGRFRSDLFYRLNIFPIHLPALRNRKEDIGLLTHYFIDRYAKKIGKKINVISKSVLQELIQYHWPGNVRELEHMIERNVLMTKGEHFKKVDLPEILPSSARLAMEDDVIPCSLEDNERKHILAALKYCAGKINGKSGAATLLGVPASTLNSRMQRLNIKKQHFEIGNQEPGHNHLNN